MPDQMTANVNQASQNAVNAALNSITSDPVFTDNSLESNPIPGMLPFPDSSQVFATEAIGGDALPGQVGQSDQQQQQAQEQVAAQTQQEIVAPYTEQDIQQLFETDEGIEKVDINRVPPQFKTPVERAIKEHQNYLNSLKIGHNRAQRVAEKERQLDEDRRQINQFLQQQQDATRLQQFQQMQAQSKKRDEELALLDPVQRQMYEELESIKKQNAQLASQQEQYSKMMAQTEYERNRQVIENTYVESAKSNNLPLDNQNVKNAVLSQCWAQWHLDNAAGNAKTPMADIAKNFADSYGYSAPEKLEQFVRSNPHFNKMVEQFKMQGAQEYATGKYKGRTMTLPSSPGVTNTPQMPTAPQKANKSFSDVKAEIDEAIKQQMAGVRSY
jgi:hypothetical protein